VYVDTSSTVYVDTPSVAQPRTLIAAAILGALVVAVAAVARVMDARLKRR
jgi:uncharacterized integral membrane protein